MPNEAEALTVPGQGNSDQVVLAVAHCLINEPCPEGENETVGGRVLRVTTYSDKITLNMCAECH